MNLEIIGPLAAISISVLAFIASQVRSARADTVEYLKERVTNCENQREQSRLELIEIKGMLKTVQNQNIALLEKLAER